MPFLLVHATENNHQEKERESYSLYLVRHAEKQINQDNPGLTQCGQLRNFRCGKFLLCFTH